MAKKKEDVVFESEGVLKKRNLMKIILPIGILVVLLLIVFLIIILLRRGKTTYTGGEQTSYPYTVTEKGDTVSLQLDRSNAPDGYLWAVARTDEAADNAVLEVEVQNNASGSSDTLVMKAKNPGTQAFSLVLQKEDGSAPISYLDYVVEVLADGSKMTAKVVTSYARSVQTNVSGGEGSSYPYEITADGEGKLILMVTDQPWKAENPGAESNEASGSGNENETADQSSNESSESETQAEESVTEAEETESADFEAFVFELPEVSDVELTEEEWEALQAEQKARLEAEANGQIQVNYQDWDCVSEDLSIANIVGPVYDEEKCTASAYIFASSSLSEENRSCQLSFRSGHAGLEIVVTVEVNPFGEIKVLSHEAKAYEAPAEESEEASDSDSGEDLGYEIHNTEEEKAAAEGQDQAAGAEETGEVETSDGVAEGAGEGEAAETGEGAESSEGQ